MLTKGERAFFTKKDSASEGAGKPEGRGFEYGQPQERRRRPKRKNTAIDISGSRRKGGKTAGEFNKKGHEKNSFTLSLRERARLQRKKEISRQARGRAPGAKESGEGKM